MFSRNVSQLNLGIMNAWPSTRYLSKKQETYTKSMGAQVQILPHSQWCNYVPISFALPVCLSVPWPAYLLAGTNMRNGK